MSDAPVPSSPGVSARMSVHPRRDTGPEVAVRRALHARGLRYRVNLPVPGTPRRTIDIAFTRRKVAVFVDGCFWHGCPEHASWPTANAGWWRAKIERNRERDEDTTRLLEQQGWTVLRFYEHEEPKEVVDRIVAAVNAAAAHAASKTATTVGAPDRANPRRPS